MNSPLEEARDNLTKYSWVAQLPDKMRSDLLSAMRYIALGAGQSLYKLDQPAGDLFGLAEGCLSVDALGMDKVISGGLLLHRGVWVGTAGLAGLENRAVGMTATRPSTLLAISAAQISVLAARHPDIWRRLLVVPILTNERLMGLADDLMRRRGQERLVAILARLGGLHERCPPSPAFIDATQEEIAGIANLSRSVVSTHLAQLERRGLISTSRASITIVDTKGLLSVL